MPQDDPEKDLVLPPNFVPSLVEDEILPDHWVLGANSQIDGTPLNDGHWLRYFPPGEPQSRGFETYNCTGFASTNVLETLWRFLFNEVKNFSDRWVGIVAGTQPPGNSPHTVFEAIRKNGLVSESSLPFDSSVDSLEKFFSPKPPTPDLIAQGKDFLAKQTPLHDWVTGGVDQIKFALKFSPLAVAVAAWFKGSDGLYYFPPNSQANHYVALVDYEEGKNWTILDSYADETGSYLKKLRWDFPFAQVKRVWFSIGQKDKSFFTQIVQNKTFSWWPALQAFLERLSKVDPTVIVPTPPVDAPKPLPEPPETLEAMAIRVCTEIGLNRQQKLDLISTIWAESGFNPQKKNYNTNGTIDWGICQLNDFWYIGKKCEIKTGQEALDNPEKCVRVMAEAWKRGRAIDWVAFKNGSYRAFLPKVATYKLGSMNLPTWLQSSDGSGDLSLRIKSALLAVLPILLFVAQVSGHPITGDQANAGIDLIVGLVASVTGIVAIIFQIKGWADRNFRKENGLGAFSK